MSDRLSVLAFRFLAGFLAMAALLALASHGCGPAQAQSPAQTHRVVKTFEAQVCHGAYCVVYRFEWRELSDDPGRHHLFRVEGAVRRQLGAWCYRACHWRSFNGRTWESPADQPPFPVPGIPVDPPPAEPTEEPPRVRLPDGPGQIEPSQYGEPVVAVGQLPPGIPDGGVDCAKLREHKAKLGSEFRYEKNGKPISREQAFAEFKAGIPDDGDAIRVTFIGPPAEADRLREDLDALPEWRGKVCFQAYASLDEPMIRGKGFQAGLQLQAADGRRLGAEATYAGPESLAEGLRNADRRRRDPDWRPKIWPPFRDPDEPRPLDGLRDLSAVTAWIKKNWLAIGAGLLALYLALKAKNKQPAA